MWMGGGLFTTDGIYGSVGPSYPPPPPSVRAVRKNRSILPLVEHPVVAHRIAPVLEHYAFFCFRLRVFCAFTPHMHTKICFFTHNCIVRNTFNVSSPFLHSKRSKDRTYQCYVKLISELFCFGNELKERDL